MGRKRKKAKRSRDESGRNRESTHYVRAGGDGVKKEKKSFENSSWEEEGGVNTV